MEYDQLFAALAAVQKDIADPNKEQAGYNYKYADLVQVLKAIRPEFSKHGLCIMQFPINEGYDVGVKTIIGHKSGQYIESSVVIPLEQPKGMSLEQALGKTITYLRRYSASAAAGISADEDNDGSNVSKINPTGEATRVIDKDLQNAQRMLQKAASDGLEALAEAWKGLPKTQQKALESVKNECKKIAMQADVKKVAENVAT